MKDYGTIGSKPGVSAYPNQSLAIEVEPYDEWPWLVLTRADPRTVPASNWKYGVLARTPLGTPVGELTRSGGDYLASKCGYCQVYVEFCKCNDTPYYAPDGSVLDHENIWRAT